MPERPREELSAIKPWLSQREHAALITGISVTLDEALNDLDRMAQDEAPYLPEEARLLDFLPRQYRARYDGRFVRRFLACLMTVGYKFAQAPWTPLSCVAEELAASAFITSAREDFDLVGVANSERAFERLEGAIFEDMDVAFLFDARFEGIEETDFAARAGVVNLAFSEWFDPFRPEVTVHPFALE